MRRPDIPTLTDEQLTLGIAKTEYLMNELRHLMGQYQAELALRSEAQPENVPSVDYLRNLNYRDGRD